MPKAFNKTFGQTMRQWREEDGLTLAEASKELGVTIGYLSQVENGLQKPSPQFTLKLGRFYEYTPLSSLLSIVRDWEIAETIARIEAKYDYSKLKDA